MSLDLTIPTSINSAPQQVGDQNGGESALHLASGGVRVTGTMAVQGNATVSGPLVAGGATVSGGRLVIPSVAATTSIVSGGSIESASLNIVGGNVVLQNLTPPPDGTTGLVDLVVDPSTGKIYRQS